MQLAQPQRSSHSSAPVVNQAQKKHPRYQRRCGLGACYAQAERRHCTRRHQLVTAFSGVLASQALNEADAETVEASIGDFKVTVRYDKFAKEYDKLDNGIAARSLGFPELRQQVVLEAQGDVLETGAGTGINLPFYHHGMIRKLTAIDQSVPMLEQAVAKVRMMAFAAPMDFVSGDVHHMPFEDNSFDAVVDTFSLCVYEDPVQALKEMARVLRPGGKLLLLEHARSDNAALGAYQDLTAPAIAAMSKGCLWNQNLSVLLKAAGLYPIKEDHHLGGTISMICAVSTMM